MAHVIQPLVHQAGDRLFVTSQEISHRFGKQHKDVLRAIRELDCTPEFNQRNFAPVEYRDGKGEKRPSYEITRDGFVFLCMGFTGHQAALWKERYIAAFNALERALREPATSTASPVPTGAALPGLKMNRHKERLLFERFVAGENITNAAKALGISRTTASLTLYGKYQFPLGAGAPECSDELIAAVAARHLAIEQERLAATQARAAQRYLQNAHNAKLAMALGKVGEHLQLAPVQALAAPKGGEQ